MRCQWGTTFLAILAMSGLSKASEADDARPLSSGAYEIRVGGERIGQE